MSGSHIKFTLKDLDLTNDLQQRLQRLENPEPLLKSIGEEYTGAGGIISTRFKEERGPDGEPWQALSAAWVKRRAKKLPGSDLTILRMHGHLVGSINYQVKSQGLSIGTGSEVEDYAAAHQFGYDGGEGKPNIPARPYLGFSNSELDVISEEVIAYLDEE
ncbi:phage virion morphogenesis protein [Epibacterium ulvae]|uniref:phage virion morphogenesis protein n=1 Tax=Epibacterium ulvae TaxID=1156985 RepID=UPI0024911E78|nr:phage virion morphogenesis protein [Epibacterium ulvae]